MSDDGRLRTFLEAHGISQADLARGVDRGESFISRLVSGETTASQETINRLISFLTLKLGRTVTYEELFLVPTAAPLVGLDSPDAA